MKTNTLLYSVTVCLALALGAGLWAQNGKPASLDSGPQKWQHLALEHDGAKVVGDPELARKINQLGIEGWELVDVEGVLDAGTTKKTVFFFKRRQ
jgi:hypothetical protein